MTAPSRVIAILQLYLGDRRVWTAEAMGRALNVSTSTAYRYVKELCAAGFLDPVTGAGYALGPAIIQYDHLLRTADTLIQHAIPGMRKLIALSDPRVDVILCRRFKDRVLCVHQENGPEPHPPTSYARGVAMPLFLGATSKVILANLPDRGLKRLYLDNEEQIRASGSVRTWKEFKEELKKVRRTGYCLTVSEVARDRAGLAAPIFRDDQVIASISIVMQNHVFEEIRKSADIIPEVLGVAREISESLNDTAAEVARS